MLKVRKPEEIGTIYDDNNNEEPNTDDSDEKKVHPEHEEKPVVESTTKTSEDVHGGDEITYSMNKPNEDGQEQQNNNGFTQQNENDQQSEMNGDAQRNQNDDIQSSNNVSQQQAISNNDDMQQDNNISQSNEDNTQNDKTGSNESTEKQQSSNNDGEDESTQQSSTDNTVSQVDQQNEDRLQTNDNDQNDTEQQEDDNQLDDSTSDESEGYDDDYEDEDGQEDTPQYNTQQAFEINNSAAKRQLYLTFYRLVEYLSDEEKQPTMLPGQSLVLNVRRLMMRQYERKPINAYYYYRTRSQVVLILDNSGSMEWLLDELDAFFAASLKRKDVQIYVAPNGHIEECYDDETKRFEAINHDEAIQQIIRCGLPIIYIGDFDGANTPIELSWTNRVFWICPETRYKYFSHHKWVGYHEGYFKGFFGRAFDDKEMIEVLQRFAKNIYKQRFWHDEHDLTDFSGE